jgi:hypothetical protein
MKKKSVGLWVAVGVAFIPALAWADEPAAAAAPAGPTLSQILVNSGITAAGYVDGSYEATFNQTGGATSGTIVGHAFDTNGNSFLLNQAALTLSYLPTSGFGALVNVIAGEDAKVINASYSGSSGSDFALTQAYVQYAAGNLTVIGGRYVTLAGAEVIDDTKNANISRSLLFTNLEPLVHTGVRAAYKFSDQFSVFAGVNNTAFAFPTSFLPVAALTVPTGADNDKHKTFEASAAYTPSTAVSVILTDYYGVDGNGSAGDPSTKNNVLDLVATWQATTAISVGANFDFDRAVNNLINGDAAGVALYVSDQLADSWKASLRAESLRAAGSASGGSAQAHVSELTATIDYAAAMSFDVLGEVRDDYGSVGVTGSPSNFGPYPDGSGTRKSQPEVLIKAIYKFGTPTGS